MRDTVQNILLTVPRVSLSCIQVTEAAVPCVSFTRPPDPEVMRNPEAWEAWRLENNVCGMLFLVREEGEVFAALIHPEKGARRFRASLMNGDDFPRVAPFEESDWSAHGRLQETLNVLFS